MAYIAPALDVLRDEINALAPSRDKRSDGWIGDSAHCPSGYNCASPPSDHCANCSGAVLALDVTHGPYWGAAKLDMEPLFDHIVRLGRAGDARINYVIFNERAAYRSGGFAVVGYGGKSPHKEHLHLSLMRSSTAYNSTKAWNVAEAYEGGDDMDLKTFQQMLESATGVKPDKQKTMGQTAMALADKAEGRTDLPGEASRLAAFKYLTKVENPADSGGPHKHSVPEGETGPSVDA